MKPDEDPLATTILNLPVFEAPQIEHWPTGMSWEQVTEHFEPQRRYYMEHFDSPEKRLREKNPEPFRMH